MNPIPPRTETGTIGELLVQLRLLLHGVQAAPPLKDSGNDLIAIRGRQFRAIQVKNTAGNKLLRPKRGTVYDILAMVDLKTPTDWRSVSEAKVYLYARSEVEEIEPSLDGHKKHELSQGLVDGLFADNTDGAQ